MDWPLISAEQALAEREELRFVDATWFLDPAKDGREAYQRGHIQGAVHFDIDTVCDHGSSLPHMLPSAGDFAAAVGAMGLSERDALVIYDQQGIFSAPRVWWSFFVMGAMSARVLDGGLPAWCAAGGEVTDEAPTPPPELFSPDFRAEAVVSPEEMKALVEEGSVKILDARPSGRFAGEDPEPRPGLASGHMRGARSIPWTEVVREGRMRPAGELQHLFAGLGITPDDVIVTTCGSGVTAAVLHLALTVAGYEGIGLFDGSWTAWASDPSNEIVTGGGR